MKNLLFVLALVLVSSTAYGGAGKETGFSSPQGIGDCVSAQVDGLGLTLQAAAVCTVCIISRMRLVPACTACAGAGVNLGVQARDIGIACGVIDEDEPEDPPAGGGGYNGDVLAPPCRETRRTLTHTETVRTCARGPHGNVCTTTTRTYRTTLALCL